MTEELLTAKPCARGCTKPDGRTPLAATHGAYCSRCWGRLDLALGQCAELALHLIGNALRTGGGYADRVDSSREAPVPFNQAAFDDANELYSVVVYWSTVWSAQTNVKTPEVAAGAWRNDRGTIIGLPADTNPVDASHLIGTLATWIRDRLDAILTVAALDDVDAFSDAINDVWRMNARWPRIDKPAYSEMPCPRQDCGAKIAVYPPTFPGDSRRVVCTSGHWYPEDEYEHLRRVFEEVARDKRQVEKTVAHLVKKYGIGA